MPFVAGIQPQPEPKPVEPQAAQTQRRAAQPQQRQSPAQQPAVQPPAQPQAWGAQTAQPRRQEWGAQQAETSQPKQPQQTQGGYASYYRQPQQRQPQQRQAQPPAQRQPWYQNQAPRQRQQQAPAQGSDEYNLYDEKSRAEIDAQRRYQGQNGNMNGYRSTYDQAAKPSGYSGREQLSAQMGQLSSNRPQQGTYVGEGVYADGTPMPRNAAGMANYEDDGRRFEPAAFPIPASVNTSDVMPPSYGQSLVQSNSGPAGGVYSGFNTPPAQPSSYGQSLVQSNSGPASGVYSGFNSGDPLDSPPPPSAEDGMGSQTGPTNDGAPQPWWRRMARRGY